MAVEIGMEVVAVEVHEGEEKEKKKKPSVPKPCIILLKIVRKNI